LRPACKIHKGFSNTKEDVDILIENARRAVYSTRGETKPVASPFGKESVNGALKRNSTLWMDFMYQGKRVRRSTGTSDKRLAEAILGKVKSQIVEGKYFDKVEEQDHTFREMMERYLIERATLKAPKSRVRDGSALKHLLPVFGERHLTEVTPKGLAAYRTQRRTDGAATATINKELQLVRHAYNLAMREWEWCRSNPMHKISLEPAHNQVIAG